MSQRDIWVVRELNTEHALRRTCGAVKIVFMAEGRCGTAGRPDCSWEYAKIQKIDAAIVKVDVF